MKPEFSRTAMLLGGDAVERLAAAHVAVFGLGGVGGALCEALARAGLGHLTIIDGDTVSLSNINRQIIATHSTVGKLKTEAMRDRILDINPDCRVDMHSVFYSADNADIIDYTSFDYIADAIDTVTSKLLIIGRAEAVGTPVISAMGTGNKTDPSRLTVTDIGKTDMCPLARVMRRELRARDINHLRVVFSREQARTPDAAYCPEAKDARRLPPGTLSTVPNVAGLMMASEIIKHITNT
ncbi:MAG: tRNA threonylcarbamoyladenosine dehydratase [Clostridia bacterium]|nr:tRNA threonylcarbamoyladenosine dehydratase [Clostridia bacterium]